MKTKILLGTLLLSGAIYAQPFQNNSANAGPMNAERNTRFGVAGITNDFFEITNSTNFDGQFIPALWAHHQTDDRYALMMFATTNSASDTPTGDPIMIFRSELRNALNLAAPTGGQFPWGTTQSNVVNRPLFEWRNGTASRMLMAANGNLGIGTVTPSAQLHTTGSVRFQGLALQTTPASMLGTDVNGNVFRYAVPTGGGVNCATPNFLVKSTGSSTTCSQVFDNGTNVGIGTSAPTVKFHTNGALRFENVATITANTYVLTSDASGNVRRQLSSTLGTPVNCLNNNYVPKRSGSAFTCSQILDNGTNVGIGTATPSYKLSVNGPIQSIANLFVSDSIYKHKVAPIANPLDIVNHLAGKTYEWKVADFPDMNFDTRLQYGLIAQELEEILPALVHTDGDGRKAVNYVAIIPILIEAIKAQQEQIVDLQSALNDGNFQRVNNDLMHFSNTKIISVSPNPSSDVIAVSLNVEEGVADAKLNMYDLNGRLLSSLNVKERTNDITKTFQKDNFGTGTYIVSLMVNGKSLDSKKIIFN